MKDLRKFIATTIREYLNENINDNKLDILLIYPKGSFGDKNNNIQLRTKNNELYNQAKTLFHSELKQKYIDLEYFLQGDSKFSDEYWLMFESWSNNDDLFMESVEYLSNKLNIDYDIV
jgi:hypothetical protein